VQGTEPWEIPYFKAYNSQLPVIEQALETAGLMLGTDKSRSYCLEMICADFLAGGVLPYSWSIASGTLPSGLSRDADTEVLSGTTLLGG